ncbi:hypothetical protein OAT67_02340 [Bacteriovoracaceae bacterium]|nr:hypothetical protein [Bacteriovoracaceae bacterium]
MPLSHDEIRHLSNTDLCDLSEEEIKSYIKRLIQSGAGNYKDDVVITALIAEENRRSSEQNAKSNSTFSKVAIGIAVSSLLITVLFSFLDWQGDKTWQDEQLKELKLININLKLISTKQEVQVESIHKSITKVEKQISVLSKNLLNKKKTAKKK